MQKGRALKESIETKQRQFTFDELKSLENELYKILTDEDIYPNSLSVEASQDKISDIEINIDINGDWKHDHLYCDNLVEDFLRRKKFILTHSSEEVVGDSETDSFESIHTYRGKLR